MAALKHKLQRTYGRGRLVVKEGVGGTRIDQIYQEGAGKIRVPKTYDKSLEAVLINTSGGLTGGDFLNWEITAQKNTNLVVTTQACEKIYKSPGDEALIQTTIKVADGARLDWLPQETILFNESRLQRQLTARLEGSARLILLEAGMLGRAAMNETVADCTFLDRWRVYRNEILVHGDDVRLNGEIHNLSKARALLNSNAAFASLAYIGPEDTDQLKVHTTSLMPLAENLGIGLSVMDGKVLARFLAKDCYHLRQKVIPFLDKLRCNLGAGTVLPKVWNL